MCRGRGAGRGGRLEVGRPLPQWRPPTCGARRRRGMSWLMLGLFGARVLPWSRHGCPPLCVALPKGGGTGQPRTEKLACHPALTNTGWLRCRGTASTAADGDEEEDDENVTPLRGGLWAIGGGRALREWLADSARRMLEKNPRRDDSVALASRGGGGVCPQPPGGGGCTWQRGGYTACPWEWGGLVWFGPSLPRTTRPTVSATVPARLDWVGRSRLSRSQGVPDC